MTLADLLFMLTGAGLMAIGVLASALADRIRGLRVSRSAARASRDPRDLRELAPAHRTAAHDAMAKDVTAVLVTSGFRKQEAADAVAACSGSECATIESWTRAALRKAAAS